MERGVYVENFQGLLPTVFLFISFFICKKVLSMLFAGIIFP